MSPDPPREDSGDDENRIRRFSGEFIEGVLNDEEFFIVPDAPYELDMEVESDYSDDSDREEEANRPQFRATRTPHNSVTVEGEEQEFLFTEGQGRARYRLLIPFPTATVTEEVAEIGGDSDGRSGEVVQEEGSDLVDNNASASNHNQLTEETASETEQPSTSVCPAEDIKREIEMSEEKVEKIKEVMKSITLPSASIPKWATELDEESWRKKLNESISSKVASKSDKNAQSSKTT